VAIIIKLGRGWCFTPKRFLDLDSDTGVRSALSRAINSLSVTNGVITVTLVAQNGILATDTYIQTPNISTNGTTTWVSSGGGVTNGYAQ